MPKNLSFKEVRRKLLKWLLSKKEGKLMNNEKRYDIKDLIIVGLVVAIVFIIAGVFIFSMKDIRENRRLNNNPNMEEKKDYDDEDEYWDDDDVKTSSGKQDDKATTNKPTYKPIATKDYITKDKAIDIALKHAGLKKNVVYELDAELDYKYGQKVYEVDFAYKEQNNENLNKAESGKIVKYFKE